MGPKKVEESRQSLLENWKKAQELKKGIAVISLCFLLHAFNNSGANIIKTALATSFSTYLTTDIPRLCGLIHFAW